MKERRIIALYPSVPPFRPFFSYDELFQIIYSYSLCLCFSFQVVMDAVNKPRNITYKGLTDLVTE